MIFHQQIQSPIIIYEPSTFLALLQLTDTFAHLSIGSSRATLHSSRIQCHIFARSGNKEESRCTYFIFRSNVRVYTPHVYAYVERSSCCGDWSILHVEPFCLVLSCSCALVHIQLMLPLLCSTAVVDCARFVSAKTCHARFVRFRFATARLANAYHA